MDGSVGTIVVGAGLAGAVLAARLVEAGENVLLIEAGPDYGPFGSPEWPAALLDPTRMPVDEVSWNYISAAQHGQCRPSLAAGTSHRWPAHRITALRHCGGIAPTTTPGRWRIPAGVPMRWSHSSGS